MRSIHHFLIILLFTLSHIKANPDITHSVEIIKKLTQDLQSSPSGYVFHHQSNSVHPGGYKADVNHGNTKIAGQLGLEKHGDMNGHGKIGSYRVAGGYGFTISHDYGSKSSHSGLPHGLDVHTGASNADLASIAVLQLGSKDSGGPSINVDEKSESLGPGKNGGLDSYVGKEIYGSYMEYDKLVKDGKKGPSVYPGEYYETDVYDGKEKYHSDDGYGEFNNGRDKGRYLESEKYDGSEDYNENKHYGALRGDDDYVDDGENDKYVIFGGYGEPHDFNAYEKSELYQGYDVDENDHEKYEPFKTNDHLTYHREDYEPSSSMYGDLNEYNTAPKFQEMRNSFLDDFFKEYNEFSNGANIQAGYKNDHAYDDDYYGNHDVEHEHGMYAAHGDSGNDFLDHADFNGDHYEEGNGETDSNFGEKKGHKKGSKTTGYRNLLHKDEYNKDHTFYEHADKNGHFNKDGDYDEHEYQNEDGYKKNRHHDSSSYGDHYGKKDSEDKGHSFVDDLADHREHGYKSYYDDNSDYSNEGDSRYDSEYEEGYHA